MEKNLTSPMSLSDLYETLTRELPNYRVTKRKIAFAGDIIFVVKSAFIGAKVRIKGNSVKIHGVIPSWYGSLLIGGIIGYIILQPAFRRIEKEVAECLGI